MSGWDSHVGKKIIWVPENGTDVFLEVIGVIRDIHFGEAKKVIEPMIIHYNPRNEILLVRTDEAPDAETQIKTIFTELFPEGTFQSYPFNDIFMMQFRSDNDFGEKIAVFAFIAILIACLGLFGLAAFITEQRTKEIGIRKVLGSNVPEVVFLLTKDFAKWVLIANLIAWPLTYFAMKSWLQNFAYKTTMNPLLFLAAGAIALIIAVLTVSFHTVKTANANPIKALKYE